MAKAFTGKMHVSIGADTSEVEKALKDLSKAVGKVSREIINFGKNVSVSLTAPLTAWGAAATAAGLKVRDALNDVAVGTGATSEALRGLQADFKAIAGQVPDDMSMSAKAIADVNTMLGATGPELQNLSKGFLDLSRITKTDLSENINSITKLMNNWGIEASSGAKVLDELLFASQQTGVSFSDLAAMVGESGNMFRTYNFSIEDAIAMLGLLSKRGVDVGKFLTGLDRSLGKLAGAGIKDMREAFDAMLMAIKNAPNDMRALQLAADLVGKISDVPLMSAVRSGGFDYGEFSRQIGEATGTLQTFREETEGFSAKAGRLTNQLTLALEPLGTHILKIAEEYMPALSDATGMLNIDFSDTTIKIGMIVAAVGPATLALGAMTAAVSSLIAALKTLIVFVSGPVGLTVAIFAAVVGLGTYLNTLYETREDMRRTGEVQNWLNEVISGLSTEQAKAELGKLQQELDIVRRDAIYASNALLNLSEAKLWSAQGDKLIELQEASHERAQVLEGKIAALNKEIERREAAQKPPPETGGTGTGGNGRGTAPNLGKSKKSKAKTGKTEAEKFVEDVQDRIKYLNEDGQKFLPTLEAMREKLKPLSDDWKKLEDLRLSIDKTAFDKSLQDAQDQIRYLNKDGAEILPKLRDMAQGLDPLSEKGKKVADVIKTIEDSLYSEKWSKYSWQFSEGLMKSSEYAELLKAELSGLEEGTDKWRAKFSELQYVQMSEVSKQLNKLSTDFHDGFLGSGEYESALNAIMQDFSEFPKIVQSATEALEAFRRQSSLSEISVGKQLSAALKEATRDFHELEGMGILRTVEGFLQATIYGEDFGESLKKLGQDIVYITLKMVILSQFMKIFGTAFGGFLGLGGDETPQINSNYFAWSNALNGISYVPKNAKGNAYANGYKLNAYAKGGLVNKPTVFPMANGMGLMGEAGAEAIMPLGRDSQGRLGVYGASVSGNNAPTVIVNVENQSGAQLTAQENGVSFDERFNRAVVSVILRDQATNGPISRNYRSVMR